LQRHFLFHKIGNGGSGERHGADIARFIENYLFAGGGSEEEIQKDREEKEEYPDWLESAFHLFWFFGSKCCLIAVADPGQASTGILISVDWWFSAS
jgi:hypothetical protein